MSDEQKVDSLGLYGNPVVRTPALEQLAARGVLFDHAFVPYPVCVPSRVSFFTGRYPRAHGSRANPILMEPSEVHLPGLLKERGYRLGLVGKNHCFRPEQLAAFDEFYEVSHRGPVQPSDDPEIEGAKAFQSQPWLLNGPCASAVNPFPPEKCGTALIGERATRFIRESRDQPFFLWVSIADPHTPFQVPEPYASLYTPAEAILPPKDDLCGKPERQRIARHMFGMDDVEEDVLRRAIAIYWGMVRFVDDQVKRLLDTLEETGLLEDTLIIFTTDHGEYLGEHGLIRKSNALYDCLVRVPLLVSWPSVVRAGERRSELVETVGVMPTILDLLGWPIPAGVQGQTFASLLRGDGGYAREAVFAEVGFEGQPAGWDELRDIPSGPLDGRFFPWGARGEAWQGRGKMGRTHDWKLVRYETGEGELYDLRADPYELRNRIDDPACEPVVRDLEGRLLRWLIATEDTLPPMPAGAITMA
ncbi:MAG: sulfatase-like hydrolase/transferase [Chloroflexota bacterium]|nr:sulfatase-like hydrolase/transferase [Chloroflexota bacterium]